MLNRRRSNLRGFDIYRVSSAAKLNGLDLPARHDLKLTPYVLASVNKDYTVGANQVISRANPLKDRNVGLDVKWGVRPNLTADFTAAQAVAVDPADFTARRLQLVLRHRRRRASALDDAYSFPRD